MEYIALALAPGLAISIYFFYTDIYNREPRLNLVISFLLGCISILPAILFERRFNFWLDGSVMGVAWFSYAGVAFTEEAAKFVALRAYAYRTRHFDEPLDGIVYSVLVSMGFATIENLLYVLTYSQAGRGLEVGIQRMFLSVPAHASFAVVMGYFVGKAKFEPAKRILLLTTGLVMAILFHGSYDFFLFLPKYSYVGQQFSEGLLAAGAIGSYIVCLWLSRKLIRRHKSLSQVLFKERNTTISV